MTLLAPPMGITLYFITEVIRKTTASLATSPSPPVAASIHSRFYDKDATSAKTDILTDNEGDNIPGNLIEIQSDDANKRVVVLQAKHAQDSSKFTPVPEHRVSTLLFAKEENPAPSPGFSHMLHLNNGGKLQISQPEITGDQLSAIHPILGPLNVSRTSIESLSKDNTDPAKQ